MAGTDETIQVVHGHPLTCHVITRRIASARRPSREVSLSAWEVSFERISDCTGKSMGQRYLTERILSSRMVEVHGVVPAHSTSVH